MYENILVPVRFFDEAWTLERITVRRGGSAADADLGERLRARATARRELRPLVVPLYF
jgi:hypothetical protein